jgi:hypothetical protein
MEHLGFTPCLTTRHPDRDEVVIVTELTRATWEKRRRDSDGPSYSTE